MNSRKATLLAVGAAFGATLLGLAALGASGLGFVGLRSLALGLLGLGAVLAAVTRWRQEPPGAEIEALAHLARACDELKGGHHALASRAASEAVTAAKSSQTRNRALTTLAWAALGQGYPERARAALDRIEPSHRLDVQCLAAVEAARGRDQFAIQALEIARTAGGLNCEGAKLLVECSLRAFGIERAVMAALQTRAVLGRENCELVVNAARVAGAHAAAATLAAAIRDADNARAPSGPGPASAIGSAAAR